MLLNRSARFYILDLVLSRQHDYVLDRRCPACQSRLQTRSVSALNSEHTTMIDSHHVELKRNFTPLEVFGIGFSVIGIVPSIASVVPIIPL